jgi:hypothetical protein
MEQPDPDLFARARNKLYDDDLWPLNDDYVFAGPGSGKACAVCDRAIESAEIDYEVTCPRHKTTVHVHIVCFQAWHEESQRSA